MKSMLLAFLTLVMTSWAAAATSPENEERILGSWKRTGQIGNYRTPMGDLVFKDDHTCSDNEDNTYTWTFENGRYIVNEEGFSGVEDGMAGKIDPSNHLELASPDGDVKWILWRDGAANPAIASSKDPTPKDLAGEWKLAYVRNSQFSTAPVLDELAFDATTVLLKSSYIPKEIEVTYALDGDQCVLAPFGITNNPLTLRMEDDGQRLIISPKSREFSLTNAEWVYLRPDQFSEQPLSGSWFGVNQQIEDLVNEIEFLPEMRFKSRVLSADGKVLNEQKGPCFYRLWSVGDRKMITFFEAPEAMLGLQANTIEYKMAGEKFEFLPVEIGLKGEITPIDEGKFLLSPRK